MNTNLPTERPDIIDRLNGLLGYHSAPTDAIITDAIAEIEQLRAQVTDWVHTSADDIDALDLDGLRRLLTRITDRVDDLIVERERDSSVTAYGLGFNAGKRAADPVEQLERDQEVGEQRRINATPLGKDGQS